MKEQFNIKIMEKVKLSVYVVFYNKEEYSSIKTVILCDKLFQEALIIEVDSEKNLSYTEAILGISEENELRKNSVLITANLSKNGQEKILWVKNTLSTEAGLMEFKEEALGEFLGEIIPLILDKVKKVNKEMA